jgi:signal transduction histidine kinase
MEESRLHGAGPRERRSASHRALEATIELLDLGSGERVFTPEWGGDEGDVDRMLELAGDCLRLHRLSVGRAGVVRVRSDVGRALLTSARQLEGRALEQGIALKFALPKEPVVWSIPDRELARLLERLLTLAIEAARPQSSLRFELHRGAARSWLNVDLDEPGPLAETLARGLSGAEASSEGAQVVLQDIRVLVLQRVARARDAKFAVQADAGVWRLALTWPTPARVPNS